MQKTTTTDWLWDEVLAALHSEGLTLHALAKRHQVHVQAISCAQHKNSATTEARIAEALGILPQQIWPSRYNPDGTPCSRREGHGQWMGKSLAVRDSAIKKLGAARKAFALKAKSNGCTKNGNVDLSTHV
jgi:Ner family transcriptional regulator